MNIDSGTHFASKEVFLNPPRELRDPPRVVLDNKGLERIMYPGIDSFNIIDESTSSLSIRIDAMKEAGFDKQCLLVANGTIPEPLLSLETSTYLQKSWNDVVAKVMRENDCFIGIAQVPTRDVDLAIEEARRATRDLGFRGIQIHGSWGSKNIESFEWWPFFEEIERLDVPLWYHATGNMAYKLFNPNMPGKEWLTRLPPIAGVFVGFHWQAELVVAGLILGGVLDRFPKLKIVMNESDASWVPHFMSWLDMTYEAHKIYKPTGLLDYFDVSSKIHDMSLKKKPSKYFNDHFYFSLNNSNEIEIDTMLPILVEKFKMQGNIVIESDYDHAEGSLDIVRRLRTLDAIDKETKDRICGKNLAELLGIDWVETEYDYVFSRTS